MKHICNFSGGWCSYFAAERTVEKHGPLNVVLLFADTLVEDPELYEFLEVSSARLGVPITRISLELTPWDLFRREKLIGNNRFPICSTKLKRELLNEWMTSNFEMNQRAQNFFFESAACVVGFDWTEEHRVFEMRANWPTWQIEAPMQEGELWDKCRMMKEGERRGFKQPELYRLGFPHFNCGGRCVRAGISHWVYLLRTKPERFAEWENDEWSTAEYLRGEGVEPLSILKDRRGGETNNLYLRDLRTRVDSGEKFPSDDWGGCGCGGAVRQDTLSSRTQTTHALIPNGNTGPAPETVANVGDGAREKF